MRQTRTTALGMIVACLIGLTLTGCRRNSSSDTTPGSGRTPVIPSESPASRARRTTPSSTPTTGAQPPGTTSSTNPGIDTPSEALAELRTLTVVPRRPYRPGYQRSCSPGDACSFGPAWTDDNNAADGHNGCGTRDDSLAEQLTDVTFRNGSRCVVESGVLHDPYTGMTVNFTKARAQLVPVDHVVPLALAWDLGAARWTQQQRVDYANDTRLVLLVVDQASNDEKSDSGPGEWMPADHGYWCAYDQRIVSILSHYRLEVTAADRNAMQAVLSTC